MNLNLSPRTAAVLQAAAGLVFVVSGALKLFGLRESHAHDTLIWEVLGRRESLYIVLAVGEIAMGALLASGIATRVLASVGLMAIIGSVVIFASVSAHGAPKKCGCFGDVELPFPSSSSAFVLRNAVVGMTLTLVVASRRTVDRSLEAPSD